MTPQTENGNRPQGRSGMSDTEQNGFKIESGITFPSGKYPFSQMNVADSFAGSEAVGAVRVAASHYGKRNNKKFSVRKTDNGFRCWRVE